jgi:hypothetical protein
MAFNKTQMMITKETIYHNEQQKKKGMKEHYHKNKIIWLKNLIKKDSIWIGVKKTILSI